MRNILVGKPEGKRIFGRLERRRRKYQVGILGKQDGNVRT
jgi:hypothetical protein